LIVIGKHKYRRQESYVWDGDSTTADSGNRAATRGVLKLKQGKDISLVDLTEETDGESEVVLGDEETFIVNQTPIPDQDAGSIRVRPHSHLFECSPNWGDACPHPHPTTYRGPAKTPPYMTILTTAARMAVLPR